MYTITCILGYHWQMSTSTGIWKSQKVSCLLPLTPATSWEHSPRGNLTLPVSKNCINYWNHKIKMYTIWQWLLLMFVQNIKNKKIILQLSISSAATILMCQLALVISIRSSLINANRASPDHMPHFHVSPNNGHLKFNGGYWY